MTTSVITGDAGVIVNVARRRAAWLAGVAEATRLRIVQALAGKSSSVTALAANLGVDIVNVSHHLGIMRAAGVVTATREGRHKIYALTGVKSVSPAAVTLAFDGCEVVVPRV